MTGYGPALRAMYSPRGCATHSFPGGWTYVWLWISIVLLVIGVIAMLASGPSAGEVIITLILAGLSATLSIYTNYYMIEGCQAKRMLETLNQREHLREIMQGQAKPATVSESKPVSSSPTTVPSSTVASF